MPESPVAVVLAWHGAVNSGDLERLLALSTDDVEVGGPRGIGQGADLLKDWFGRAGIQLTPRRVFQDDDRVVVDQAATWGNAGPPQEVASAFRIRDGLVASVVRHPDLATALQAAGLDETDERVLGG